MYKNNSGSGLHPNLFCFIQYLAIRKIGAFNSAITFILNVGNN